MNRLFWAMALALVLGAPAAAWTHPGHTHKILGTISTLHEQHLEVLDKSGETSTFTITKDTKILVGDKKGTTKDLELGVRVVVEGEENEDGKAEALVIRLAARAAK